MVLRVRESISPQFPQKETKTIHRFCYVVFLRQSCKFYCLRWTSAAIVFENLCKKICHVYCMFKHNHYMTCICSRYIYITFGVDLRSCIQTLWDLGAVSLHSFGQTLSADGWAWFAVEACGLMREAVQILSQTR